MSNLEKISCQFCFANEIESIGGNKFRCPHCGNIFEVTEKLTEEENLTFNRAEYFRKNKKFDDALNCYEEFLSKKPRNERALWGAFLAEHGIEYVDDGGSFKPTCHRMSLKPVSKSKYYENLSASDKEKTVEIEQIRQKIEEQMKGIKPYDVFICYKAKDENGRPTKESNWGRRLNEVLTYKHNLKVFFAEVTLSGSNVDYEPHIYSALRSCKLMLVLTSSMENLTSAWVQNEWMRFYEMSQYDTAKVIRVVYENMEPYDFPRQLQGKQMINQDEGDWQTQVINATEEIFGDKKAEEEAQKAAQAKAQKDDILREVAKMQLSSTSSDGQGSNTIGNLLKRARMELSSGRFKEAWNFAEKVLNIDVETAEAWWIKFLAQQGFKSEEIFKTLEKDFTKNDLYLKAIEFADEETAEQYKEAVGNSAQRFMEKLAEEKARKEADNMIASVLREARIKKERKLHIWYYILTFVNAIGLIVWLACGGYANDISSDGVGGLFKIDYMALLLPFAVAFVIQGILTARFECERLHRIVCLCIIGAIALIFFIIATWKGIYTNTDIGHFIFSVLIAVILFVERLILALIGYLVFGGWALFED